MMRLADIEKKAKGVGIKDTWKHSKKDLIRMIQRQEGNFQCFGTVVKSCGQMACCWRTDCIKK
ncbi:MAG: SAP domain-containing protein [Candidatus Omnitrophota bacterium]